MRNAPVKRLTKVFFTLTIIFLLGSCTNPQESDYQKAEAYIKKGYYRKAAKYLDQAIKRNEQTDVALLAMKEAARITFLEIKDYKKAASYYQLIIRYSSNEIDRLEAQKQLASLYFESLQDYERAAVEYSKLATTSRVDSERALYKLSVARSYYYLGNYFQTLSEIEEILKLKSDKDVEFQARLLHGNVSVAQKKFGEAAKTFQEIIAKFPEKSLKENVHLVLSLSLEESGDYRQALSVLEKIQDRYEPKEYLDLRIKRIQERAENQPGARGYNRK